MMISADAGLLSAGASAVWMAALCVVLVFHCGHLIRMHGERRWYHGAHVTMLLGMLYMYASVAFGLELLPAHVWLIIYVATSAAIIIWIWERYRQRRSFGHLWVVALVQQGAMIYMWAPMNHWLPLVSYVFAAYFALETSAWLTRACIKPAPGAAVAGANGSLVMPLAHRSVRGDICMAIMAASMGYMFVGMQLMMSMPRHSQQLAQRQPLSASGPARYDSASGTPARTPELAPNEPARPSAETPPAASAETYTVIAGDSLRSYRGPSLWRRSPLAEYPESQSGPPSSPIARRSGDQIARSAATPVGTIAPASRLGAPVARRLRGQPTANLGGGTVTARISQ